MTMTAQYRPYRDEESPDSEHNGWAESEPAIQIYEKTTEDSSFKVERYPLLWIISAILLVAGCAFVLGYITHSTSGECFHKLGLLSSFKEDYSIRVKLRQSITNTTIFQFFERLTAPFGLSDYDYASALRMKSLFMEQGFDHVALKNYDALLSLPDKARPNYISLENDRGDVHYTSLDTISDHQAFCLYSPKGNVTGDVMFVNYGRPIDYFHIQQLFNTSENIFAGKILLVKQHRISANEQYKYAMHMNAGALLLYPDPQHYNPKGGKAFPETIWLPADGVKSDSIFWNGAGDPETFGLPSNEYTFRDAFEFSEQVSMPAQPISALDALELFKLMNGIETPEEWRGGLNVTYRIGPGLRDDLTVRVVVNNVLKNKTITNVIGSIRGDIEPDRYVIIGNKRDSLAKGAIDSRSGTAVFLELARVFHKLLQAGWKPRRTIMFCSWGAEEFNLIGSTEWVEEYHKILYMRAVAYINVNLVVTGNDSLSVAASPLLYHAVFNATKGINLPRASEDDESVSVYHNWVLSTPVMRNSSTLVIGPNALDDLRSLGVLADINDKMLRKEQLHLTVEDLSEPGNILKANLESARQQIRPHVRRLDMYGSYASFVTMAGIPALDLSFIKLSSDFKQDFDDDDEGGKTFIDYPLLHTQYDHPKIVSQQVDLHFSYHELIAQLLAEIIRDLVDSLFLPFNLFDYAQLLKDFNLKSQHLHTIIVSNAGDLVSSDLHMDNLGSAITNFTNEAIRFHSRQDRVNLNDPMAIRRINDQLLLIERQFLDHRGMPANNLKKHLILSPAETMSSMSVLQTEGLFPALLDELDQIIGNAYKKDTQLSMIRLQKHLPILINTIQGAAESLADFI